MSNIRHHRLTATFRRACLALVFLTAFESFVLCDDGTSGPTHFGALTTTFTPNPDCFTETLTDQRQPLNEVTSPPYIDVNSCFLRGMDGCCPSGWGVDGYFSPGVCPSGYTSCLLPVAQQREETTELCCPSNWVCPDNVNSGQCSSILAEEITQTYTGLNGEIIPISFEEIYATPIEIRYQEGDFDGEEGGLDLGAKLGIGFGVSIGVLLTLCCCCCCCRATRRIEKESEVEERPRSASTYPPAVVVEPVLADSPAEMTGSAMANSPAELNGSAVAELSAEVVEPARSELPTWEVRPPEDNEPPPPYSINP